MRMATVLIGDVGAGGEYNWYETGWIPVGGETPLKPQKPSRETANAIKVLRTTPSDGAQGVIPPAAVTAVFSLPPEPGSLVFKLYKTGGAEVPSTVQIEHPHSIGPSRWEYPVSLTPAVALERGTRYEANLDARNADVDLGARYRWSFTTVETSGIESPAVSSTRQSPATTTTGPRLIIAQPVALQTQVPGVDTMRRLVNSIPEQTGATASKTEDQATIGIFIMMSRAEAQALVANIQRQLESRDGEPSGRPVSTRCPSARAQI